MPGHVLGQTARSDRQSSSFSYICADKKQTSLNKKSLFYLSLLIQAITIIALATGASFLAEPMFGGALPWGNLLTGLLLTLFPINFLIIRRAGTTHRIPQLVYRICVYLGMVLGAGWLFVSYALAGNWSTTFQGGGLNQRIWTYYTYTAAIAPFAGYFLMKVLSGFIKK